MNKEEIMQILPHREDMLLLDDAENVGYESIAHYTVRGDEFFLRGHFPGNAIVPGVILCEILAQSACVFLKDTIQDGKLAVYTGLNNVKFRSSVKPGDKITAKSRIKRAKYPFYFAEGEIFVEDRLCASAEFSFAITGE